MTRLFWDRMPGVNERILASYELTSEGWYGPREAEPIEPWDWVSRDAIGVEVAREYDMDEAAATIAHELGHRALGTPDVEDPMETFVIEVEAWAHGKGRGWIWQPKKVVKCLKSYYCRLEGDDAREFAREYAWDRLGVEL